MIFLLFGYTFVTGLLFPLRSAVLAGKEPLLISLSGKTGKS